MTQWWFHPNRLRYRMRISPRYHTLPWICEQCIWRSQSLYSSIWRRKHRRNKQTGSIWSINFVWMSWWSSLIRINCVSESSRPEDSALDRKQWSTFVRSDSLLCCCKLLEASISSVWAFAVVSIIGKSVVVLALKKTNNISKGKSVEKRATVYVWDRNETSPIIDSTIVQQAFISPVPDILSAMIDNVCLSDKSRCRSRKKNSQYLLLVWMKSALD
jgi:hypothetical protein